MHRRSARTASERQHQHCWRGARKHHGLILAPGSFVLIAAQIASALIFLLSKCTVNSSVFASMSILPTPSTPDNELRTAATQAPQIFLPSSNLEEVSVTTLAAFAGGVLPPPTSGLASAVQPARSSAKAPAVINRIMVSLGFQGPRGMSAGGPILLENSASTHNACLPARGSPKVAPTGMARSEECST